MNDRKYFQWSDVEPVCVIRMVLRNLWTVVAAVLIGVMGMNLALTWLYTPQYTSSITYAVLSKSTTASSRTNYTAANEVAVRFSSMLESSIMRDVLCKAMGSDTLPGSISAAVVGETNMLRVSAVAASPKDAFELIRAVDENYSSLGVQIEQNAVLRVISSAQAPSAPSNPVNTRRYLMAAGGVGGIAMIALLVWFSVSADTIQNRSAARHKLDADLLAVIPQEKRWRQKREKLLITSPLVSFFFQEAFFRLRSAVEHGLGDRDEGKSRDGKILMVTSVTESEGKSTVACNLALALAQKHKAVLLIDADLRNPTQIRMLGRGAKGSGSLARLLQSGSVTAETLAAEMSYNKEQNLITLLDESPRRDASELLASDAMAQLLHIVKKTMDYVVIDTPPAGMFADGNLLADQADGAVLVVEQDLVPAGRINDVTDTLSQGHAKLLGCVLNRVRKTPFLRRSSGYGYGYVNGYGYGYGSYGKDKSKSASRREVE